MHSEECVARNRQSGGFQSLINSFKHIQCPSHSQHIKLWANMSTYFPWNPLSASCQDFLLQNCHPHPALWIFPFCPPRCDWALSQLYLSSTEECCNASFLHSRNPAKAPMVPLPCKLLITEVPCASLACCSLNLVLLLCLFPLESLHLLVTHLQHQGRECSAAATAQCHSVEPPQNPKTKFSQSS